MTETATLTLTADDLLWNWARWCWAGETVGNMTPYQPARDDFNPIMIDHAQAVERMHQALPRHEQMVVIAEYPQKNVRFGMLNEQQRRVLARRWIGTTTGVWMTDELYSLYLGLFRDAVGRQLT